MVELEKVWEVGGGQADGISSRLADPRETHFALELGPLDIIK